MKEISDHLIFPIFFADIKLHDCKLFVKNCKSLCHVKCYWFTMTSKASCLASDSIVLLVKLLHVMHLVNLNILKYMLATFLFFKSHISKHFTYWQFTIHVNFQEFIPNISRDHFRILHKIFKTGTINRQKVKKCKVKDHANCDLTVSENFFLNP